MWIGLLEFLVVVLFEFLSVYGGVLREGGWWGFVKEVGMGMKRGWEDGLDGVEGEIEYEKLWNVRLVEN